MTVTFNSFDVPISMSQKQVYQSHPYSDLPTITDDGYVLKGWYRRFESGQFSDQVTSDTVVSATEEPHTLYANWESIHDS